MKDKASYKLLLSILEQQKAKIHLDSSKSEAIIEFDRAETIYIFEEEQYAVLKHIEENKLKENIELLEWELSREKEKFEKIKGDINEL